MQCASHKVQMCSLQRFKSYKKLSKANWEVDILLRKHGRQYPILLYCYSYDIVINREP